MKTRLARANVGLALTSLALLAGAVIAHEDDPKLRDLQPRHEGRGWRASDRDARGDPIAAPLGFESSGVDMLAWFTLGEFAGNQSNGNDCWGYVSPSGREYALMGMSDGLGIVEITDPGNAQIVTTVAGPSSLWRDVKVHGNHAYVVTEGTGAGIQVISLANVDAGQAPVVATINTGGNTNTHNVAIDETSGFLYRCGGDNNGLRMYSLANPANPVLVGQWNTRYVHDAQIVTYTSGPFAGRQIAFCCAGFNGGFVDTGLTIVDVTNKAAPVELAHILYPSNAYSHQGWLSEDRTIFYLGDELDENGSINSRWHMFDVADIENASYIGAFSNASTAVTHNLYAHQGRLFAANYRSGLRVLDYASDPLNPAEIAYFDTWPGDDGASYNGLWSTYPYFPSGTIIGSDIEKGLFVFRLNLPTIAISLEGGAPDLLDPNGQTLVVRIEELAPDALVPGSARVHWDAGDGAFDAPLASAGGDLWTAELPSFACATPVSYWFSADQAGGGTITLPAGAPGQSFAAVAADEIVTLVQNDMESDAGYTVQNVSLTGGAWQRGVPAGLGDRGDPTADADGSGACWLTENGPGNTDVDGGPTRLTTNLFDLSGAPDAFISYARWFTNDDADIDRLDVEISANGGSTWTAVESVPGAGNAWVVHSFRVSDFVTPGAQMRLRFSATDNPNDSVTEGGVDALRIFRHECAAVSIPGDVNGDLVVDFQDLLELLAAWGACPAPPAACPADFDDSGAVDFQDLLTLLGNWS